MLVIVFFFWVGVGVVISSKDRVGLGGEFRFYIVGAYEVLVLDKRLMLNFKLEVGIRVGGYSSRKLEAVEIVLRGE